ncbi:MAG: ribonuclease R [Myxococcales bacterium]
MTRAQTQGEKERRQRILDALRKRKNRALHVAEIRGRIGLSKAEHAELFRLLEQLAEEGYLTQLPGGRFRLRSGGPPRKSGAPPEAKRSGSRRGRRGAAREREGRLILNARGFGFVTTEGEDEDVFIPPARLGQAMHGDRVRVTVSRGPKGLDGRVVEIVQRAMQYLGGQLHFTPDGTWLEPDDERLRMPIRILGKLPEDARTGQGVIAQVEGFPEREGDPLKVRVIETFEPDEFVQFEIRRILLREGVSEEFPEDVQAEGDALPSSVPAADKKEREDLRGIPLLTIDPSDARDHDDAVHAVRLSDGGYRVLIAIADVSHYVPEGSALDEEALARGCTIYLPSRAIPMLPHALSSNLASLVPKRDRLTLAVEIDLTANGAVKRHRFIEGVMRSAARLSYEGVARALGLTDTGRQQPAALHFKKELEVLLEVAELQAKRRRRRGALGFELPEAKVKVDDETGKPIDVERSRRDPGVGRAYGMIEQLMLLANEVVAADLHGRGVPTIYRVHGEPDPDRVETFCALARSLGYDLGDDVAEDPKKLARFLARVHDTPHSGTLGYLLLRAMQQATYQTENIGHFGLAAKEYLHFTSPIRRYPDLAVHRVVRRIARGQRATDDRLEGKLQHQAEQSSQRERRAMAIEREVVDLYGAYLMRNQVGEEFEGVISGIAEHGFYTTLDSPFVDVLCRTASLPADRYELDPYGVRLTGMSGGLTFALGDRVRLRIEDVSIAQRKVIAVLAEIPHGWQEGDDPRARRGRRGRSGGRSRGRDGGAREPRDRRRKRDDKDARRTERKGKGKGKGKSKSKGKGKGKGTSR